MTKENSFGLVDRRTFLKTTATTVAGAMFAPILFSSDHDYSQLPQQRYPDPSIVILDKRFEKYFQFNAAVERLWTGARWTEGPVWFGDIPNNRILRWTEESGKVSVFRNPSNYSNGSTRDRQGRLISCEHDTRRVTRTEPDLKDTIRRLQAFQEAGADVLYAPNLRSRSDISSIVSSVDKPVNVMIGASLTVSELSEIGVKRISHGSTLIRASFGELLRAASEIKDNGTYSFVDKVVPFSKLTEIFKQ